MARGYQGLESPDAGKEATDMAQQNGGEVVRGFTVNVYGQPGVGKTTFAFTFPSPIWFARFDRRSDDIVAQARAAGVEVHEEGFVGAAVPDDPRGEAEGMLSRFEEFVDKALNVGKGTFVIDGGNRLWDIVQRVKLPDVEGVVDAEQRARLERRRRLLYGAANEYMHSTLLMLDNSPLFVVITHHTKPVFNERGEEVTGLLQPDYFRRVPYVAQLEVFLFATRPSHVSVPSLLAAANSNDPAARVFAPPSFYAVVTMCKMPGGGNLEGRVIRNLSFPVLWLLLYGQRWDGPTVWHPFGEGER